MANYSVIDQSERVFTNVCALARVQPLHEKNKYSLIRWVKSGFLKWLKIVRKLCANEAVCAWADARVHIIMFLSGIPTRIGFTMNAQNYLGIHDPRRKKKLCAGKRLIKIGIKAILVVISYI